METVYSKKSIRREILHIAWPSIAEQMLIMMVGMVSTIFVGRLGKESMAAVGMINMLIFFFQTIFSGLATGSTVVIARVTGEKENSKAKTALIQSIILCIGAGALVTFFGYSLDTQIMKLFFGSAEPKVFDIALKFYRIVLMGLPFLVIDMVIASSVRGAGDTKTPMYVTGIVNIINLILNSILIFGLSFNNNIIIPAMGVTGAAVAVTVSRVCGSLIRLWTLYFKKGKLNLSFKDKYKIEPEMMMRIIKIGIPAFLEQFIMQGGFLAMQIMIVSIGTLEMAAYQVGVNVNSLAFMPIFGFSVAATTMVGQSLGRCNYEEAENYAGESKKMAVAVITIIGILMFIFARPLAMLFSTESDVIDMSVNLIRIFAVLEPFLGVMNTCAGVLRAAGDVKYVMVSALVGLWLFRVTAAYILIHLFHIGIYAAMVGVCLDFGVRAAMYGFRVKAGKWKTLKV